MEMSHHTSFHMGWMIGLKVEILVPVGGFPVAKDVQAAILSSPLSTELLFQGCHLRGVALHSDLALFVLLQTLHGTYYSDY